MSYNFVLLSKPEGSVVELVMSGNTAFFTTDLIGTYEIKCAVSDGKNEISETISIFAGIKSVGSYQRLLKTTESIKSTFVSGNYLYAVSEEGGLKIFYMSDPSKLHFLSSLDTDGNASGVAVSGNYAYVSDGDSGLKVIDITDKSHPVLSGSIDTDGVASGICISGDYAYIADGNSGLKIINITSKISPVLEGSVDTDGKLSESIYRAITRMSLKVTAV